MRLPSHILKLCLASTAIVGCEPAHEAEPEPEPTPVERASSNESLYDEFRDELAMLPAVAPKYVQPQQHQRPLPQPQPQPQVKPKPPRRVQTSICGHAAPPNATPSMLMMRCGKG